MESPRNDMCLNQVEVVETDIISLDSFPEVEFNFIIKQGSTGIHDIITEK